MTELFKIVSSLIYHILIPFISILFFTIIYCSHTFIAIFASAFSHDQVSQPYNLFANFLPLYYILLPSFQNLTHLYFFSIRLLPKMMFPRSLIQKVKFHVVFSFPVLLDLSMTACTTCACDWPYFLGLMAKVLAISFLEFFMDQYIMYGVSSSPCP